MSLEERNLDKTDPAYRKIPLVVNTAGTVLQRVEACTGHDKEVAKLSTKRKGMQRSAEDDPTSKRDIRPLPSNTANPRPLKRRREETWEEYRQHPVNRPSLPRQGLYTIAQSSADEDYDTTQNYAGDDGYVLHRVSYHFVH